MNTKTKNAILKMIEVVNNESIYEFKIEGLTKSRNEDGTLSWSFSVYQVEKQKDGSIRYRDVLSDPSMIMNIANATMAGSYVSVDVFGNKPEDWDALKLSMYGKPYVRIY